MPLISGEDFVDKNECRFRNCLQQIERKIKKVKKFVISIEICIMSMKKNKFTYKGTLFNLTVHNNKSTAKAFFHPRYISSQNIL